MDPAEYERRKQFCAEAASMNRSECIEIARILRSHSITVSENRSGVFFDMTKIPQAVFEELVKFRDFVNKNNLELETRPVQPKAAAHSSK
jgi:hypothetical protein